MGFSNKRWASVWSIEPYSDTATKGRISCSRKNKDTGEYEDDFSGFVMFVGSATAQKALKLKERDRIRLGDVEVKTKYVKETNTKYTNFYIYSFETADEVEGGGSSARTPDQPIESGEDFMSASGMPELPF